MIEKVLKINLKLGLHARPSAYIVSKLKNLRLNKSCITLKGNTADPKSIMSLLSLFAIFGDEVKVFLDGPDEDVALKILEDVFNEKDNDKIYNENS